MSRSVTLFEPLIGREEEEAVLRVLRRNWLSMGPETEAFEREFAAYLGVNHAVAVNSCTAALHLACQVAGLGPGDEVIVPSLTFVATANAVRYTGASVRFVDIESESDWTISVSAVESMLTDRTRAVIAMHYAGAATDLKALRALCDARGLHLIEDACHGLGSTLDGEALGTFGETGCFSFYSNKIMTTGEGGMLTTNDAGLADYARKLRAHGLTNTAIDRVRGALGYDVVALGHNYRLDDIRAAIGRTQLSRLPASIARRQELVRAYDDRLAELESVSVPTFGGRTVSSHYIYPTLLGKGINRDAVRERMSALGVQTSVHYAPVHLFEHYKREGTATLPLTEDIAARCITLPLYPQMRDDDPEFVVDVMKRAIADVAGAA